MDSNQIDQMFDSMGGWINNMSEQVPLEASVASTFQHFVIQSMFDQDRDFLRIIKQKSNPLRNRLRSFVKTIPIHLRQAMNISLSSNLVDQFLFLLEEEDPVSSAKHIRHGEKILTILNQFKDEELNQKLICENWPDAKGVSPSTISRAVAALEEAGFLRQQGSTKGRKIHLLPKADNWQILTRSKKDFQETGGFQPDPDQPALMAEGFDPMGTASVSTADTYGEDINEPDFQEVNTIDQNDFRDIFPLCN